MSEEQQEKKGLWTRLKDSMKKTRDSISGRIDELVRYYKEIDDEFFEELTDILIAADVGAQTSQTLVDTVAERVRREKIGDPQKVKDLLAEAIAENMAPQAPLALRSPAVILMVGVNGVGKTTSTGKLAAYYKAQGKSVMLAAGDTFRAAATEQLQIWGERADVPVVAQGEGSDPAAVVFDAIHAAKARNIDVLICDTAGRLHNKVNLMKELTKIRRVIDREYPAAQCETFLVLDATTGQNALIQAETFAQACDITGLVLAKLDGTAKGGVALAITSQLDVPVRFVCTGEGIGDIEPFDAQAYGRAIFEG